MALPQIMFCKAVLPLIQNRREPRSQYLRQMQAHMGPRPHAALVHSTQPQSARCTRPLRMHGTAQHHMQCSPSARRLLTSVGGLCAGTRTSGWQTGNRGVEAEEPHLPHDQPAASHTVRSAMDWDGVQDCGAPSFASWLILLARCVWRVHPQQHSRLEDSGAGRMYTKGAHEIERILHCYHRR
jgi:hypothetical protein